MIYPNNFEEKIGFDKIRNLIKNKAISTLGKEKVDEIEFLISEELIDENLSLIEEFKIICEKYDDFPTSYFFDIREQLSKIKIENSYLSVAELFDLKRSLETIKSILNFFKTKEETTFPFLKKMSKQVQLFPFVYEKIDFILNKNGQIKDNASAELKNIKISMANKQNAVSKVINEIFKKAQNEGFVESDATLTIRDGKMLIPISASNKRKIKGLIYDESATGKTAFIEPLESIEINNQLRELEFAERREIIKILVLFATEIRPYIDELLQNYDFLAQIDFIRAKALFAFEINAIKPNILNTPTIDYRYAIHPLLYLSLRKENRKVVPLDLEIDSKNRIVLISGPNAGGKSVCLKTIGLLQYMFQCGILIPVKETSHIGIFKKIFIDIGDQQSIENDLSTYSSHLFNMKHFLENADSETIILIDEFGTGTEPIIGAAIAESILEKLNQNNVRGVITTHYTNLKHLASNSEGIINGAMLFDSLNMRPLFMLDIGKPGSSFAFEIATKIGLPQNIIQNAENKVGKDHVNFEKHLQQLETDKKTLKIQAQKIEKLEKDLVQKTEKLDKEIEFTLNQRKSILNLSKEQANNILSTANKLIENTIYEIRQSNAVKEPTKIIRKEFEEARQEFAESQLDEEQKILEKIERIKQKQLEKLIKPKTVKEQRTIEKIEDKTIKIGDTVRLDKQDNYGVVEELKDDNAMIVMGNLRTFVKLKRLEKVSHNEIKNKNNEKSKITVNFDVRKEREEFLFGLDIRGFRVDEALQKVIQYLDDAIVAGASELKILHGTGNGILRQVVRDYLQTQPVVKSCKDEKIQFGGSGISIVELEY